MKYTVAESKDFPGDWIVSAIGPEGEIYLALFSGPNCQRRALEYQAHRNAVEEIYEIRAKIKIDSL